MFAEWKTYGGVGRTWLATQVRSASDGTQLQVLYDLHYRGEGERGLVCLDTPGEGTALYGVHRTDRAREYAKNPAFTVYPNARVIVANDPLTTANDPVTIEFDRRIFLGEVDRAKARALGDLVFFAVSAWAR